MDEQLKKIASNVPAMLAEGARVTRKLAQDNLDLIAEKEAATTSLHVHKLAMRMHERGLEPSLTLSEKVAMLEKVEPSKLAGIEAAVEMSAGGFKLASLRVDEDIESKSKVAATKSPGELGSSAHYEALDAVIQGL